jgi:hypothetical protein
MENKIEQQTLEFLPELQRLPQIPKQAMAQSYSYGLTPNGWSDSYSPTDVDRLEFSEKEFKKIIESCRFFYRKDPIVSSVINKMIDIGINDLVFDKGTLTDNEYRVFEALRKPLLEFAEMCAMEYLISGLVIPEVGYEAVNKDVLKR